MFLEQKMDNSWRTPDIGMAKNFARQISVKNFTITFFTICGYNQSQDYKEDKSM